MEVNKWGEIKFSDRVIVQTGEKYTILHNVNNMKTVRITTEAYHIVKEICEKKWKVNKVLYNCKTQEDQEYLENILLYLADNYIIREWYDFLEYRNIDLRIDLDITNRCNLRCRHCCVSAEYEKEDLEYDDMLKIVHKVADLSPKAIVISGGEPLIRTDFKDIIDELKKEYKGYLALMTNGILINQEMAEYISDNFDSVSISLDGIDEETCSVIRGTGTFQKTINGIKKLQDVGMKNISASMVVSKATYDKKMQFKELCQSMHIQPMIRGLAMVGRAELEMLEFLPSEEEEIKCEKSVNKLNIEEKSIPLLFSCGAAFKQFQIDYCGNIFPCQSLMDEELKLGNVLEINDLNEYIRNRMFTNTKGYKNLEKYFPYNYEECRKCNKQIFCWNCIETLYRNKRKHDGCKVCKQVFERFFD